MLPAMGSTMTQAMASPFSRKRLFELGQVVVVEHDGVLGKVFRHAGRRGLPKVSRPEPALTSRLSAWPW
jgi:hypothetical protein